MRIGLGQIWLELSDFQNITAAVETFEIQIDWSCTFTSDISLISPLLRGVQIVALATCFKSIVISDWRVRCQQIPAHFSAL